MEKVQHWEYFPDVEYPHGCGFCPPQKWNGCSEHIPVFPKERGNTQTYKNGGRSVQVDYIKCGRGILREIGKGKFVAGKSVARHNQTVVCGEEEENRGHREDQMKKE